MLDNHKKFSSDEVSLNCHCAEPKIRSDPVALQQCNLHELSHFSRKTAKKWGCPKAPSQEHKSAKRCILEQPLTKTKFELN